MTGDEKIKRIREIVQRRAQDGSHKNAKRLLIKEGILNAHGKLSPEYGGKAAKRRRKAAQAA